MAQDFAEIQKQAKVPDHFLARFPAVEVEAMAAIILVMKVHCGLNNSTEVQLSRAAERINVDLRHHRKRAPLFSWMAWHRYDEVNSFTSLIGDPDEILVPP